MKTISATELKIPVPPTLTGWDDEAIAAFLWGAIGDSADQPARGPAPPPLLDKDTQMLLRVVRVALRRLQKRLPDVTTRRLVRAVHAEANEILLASPSGPAECITLCDHERSFLSGRWTKEGVEQFVAMT